MPFFAQLGKVIVCLLQIRLDVQIIFSVMFGTSMASKLENMPSFDLVITH